MEIINTKNHKNLRSNVPLEELPKWFQEAVTENANVSYNNGIFIWKNGTWEDGIWNGSTWKEGLWKFGRWNNGEWCNGVWECGIWKTGIWKDGTWKGGNWGDGEWKTGYKEYSGSRCKWTILYNTDTKTIRIGCKEKTVKKWKKWFNNPNLTYETSRNTTQFLNIQRAFNVVKQVIKLEQKYK